MKRIKQWFYEKHPELYTLIGLIWWVMMELMKEDESEVKP